MLRHVMGVFLMFERFLHPDLRWVSAHHRPAAASTRALSIRPYRSGIADRSPHRLPSRGGLAADRTMRRSRAA
jgi:hypothetical protein